MLDRLCGDLTAAGRTALGAFLAALLVLPVVASGYPTTVALICLYLAFLGQAWNLMFGFAGLLSLGHALFVGLGAYAGAYLFVQHKVPAAVGITPGVALAAAAAGLIGVLAFRFAIGGVYFALLTIACAEFTRILAEHARFLHGTDGLFLPVAAEGRRGIDLLHFRGGPAFYYYLILAFCAGAFVLCRLLLTSRVGFYWRAIRDNPDAAAAVGVPLLRYRLYAVMTSAALAGLAGVFYAFYYNNLFANDVFNIQRSIEVTLAPIVGGVGTAFGPILGAFVLTPLSEVVTACVRWLQAHGLIAAQVKADAFKPLFFGLVVMGIVLAQPRGLWPWLGRRLRLFRRPDEQA